MKFAIIGHQLDNQKQNQIIKGWQKHNDFLITPELDFNGTKGNGISILLSPKQIIQKPIEEVRKIILKAAVYGQNELGEDIVQLGGLTTSVTSGGVWLTHQDEYRGFVNHGDSFTAAVTCQSVMKALKIKKRKSKESTLAVIGAYGIIGEAVSRILVPLFNDAILIGRRQEKLKELSSKIKGMLNTSLNIEEARNADVIVTATSHTSALLKSEHLKSNAIVIDVSQPNNVSPDVCTARPDIFRVDGGFVDSPIVSNIPLMPPGKIFACIAEVIMQAIEDDRSHHVGSININHLRKTETWAKKHGFIFNDLTNFGVPIKII